MKKIIMLTALCLPVMLYAQNALTSNFVEGGKTLVELIRVLRTPKTVITNVENNVMDSCGFRNLADLSFKNKTDKSVQVLLYLRIGNKYDTQALPLRLAAFTQESLYEVKAGIYKYRIETEEEDEKVVLHEGELKLKPCDKLVKEIKK